VFNENLKFLYLPEILGMNPTMFQIINYTLLFIFLILFLRYLWIVFFSGDDQPVAWQQAINNRNISALLKRMKRKYPDKARFFNWWLQIERLKREHVPGVFAELGVYKGDSARVIHQMDPGRPFHLFDTYTGFTAGDLKMESGEAATYTTDHFADTSVEAVLKKIRGNHNIIIHQGYFPDTARDFKEKIALVSMDADLFKPTKAALELFYPLLSPGGIIMVHDYNHKWPGIIRAVDDFVRTIPESLVILPDINCTAMIIRNSL
jgi:O-methyltransferase